MNLLYFIILIAHLYFNENNKFSRDIPYSAHLSITMDILFCRCARQYAITLTRRIRKI